MNYRSLIILMSLLFTMEIITITVDELNELYNEYNNTTISDTYTDEEYLMNLQQQDFNEYTH